MLIRKTAVIIAALTFLFTLVSCGERTGSGTTAQMPSGTLTTLTTVPETSANTSEENNSSDSQPNESATTPTVSPVIVSTVIRSRSSIYGENSGTEATFTGLEPLPLRDFTVSDAENSAGYSCERRNHSYGVAKNETPHSISVNNAQYYLQYGAFTLDTSSERSIYLTFDCGYENGNTMKILDVLLEKGVPAAFFVTLPYIKSSPEIVTRMINEGHTVGNHSNTHRDFSSLSRTEMAQEIADVDNYLRQHFGYSAPFFRFPEGACSDNSLELIASLGYTSVFWSSAYADWDDSNSKGKDYAFETVTSRLHPGCVQLLHVASKDNADALGEIIDYAIQNGYTFKTLESNS